MATGSHGQLTKPFHLTPGTAGMFQLFKRLKFPPLPVLGKIALFRTIHPCRSGTQPRRLTLALTPPSLIVDIPCRRRKSGGVVIVPKVGLGGYTKNGVFHGTARLQIHLFRVFTRDQTRDLGCLGNHSDFTKLGQFS